MGDPRRELQNLRQLLRSSDPGERQRAIEELEDERATEDLVAALRDTDAINRQVALHALARLAEPTTVQAIRMLVEDDDPGVRAAAARALGAAGGASALKWLVPMLKDSDALVRKWVVLALWGTRADPAIAILERVERGEPDAGVREEATNALRDLRGEGPPVVKPRRS